MKLIYKGQEISNPEDAIKDPMVLEFLGLPESHQLIESKLEIALINNLQNFLLELGKGFAFVARQKDSRSIAITSTPILFFIMSS